MVLALADTCAKITIANFRDCENLTDATKEAVTAQRPDFNFEFWQLEVQQRLHVKNTPIVV